MARKLKNNPTVLLIFGTLKKNKYNLLVFQNITQPVKNQ